MGGVSCKKCQEVLEIQGEHRVSGVFEPLALRVVLADADIYEGSLSGKEKSVPS